MLHILAPPLLLYGGFPEPPLHQFESRKFGFTLDQKAVRPHLGLKSWAATSSAQNGKETEAAN